MSGIDTERAARIGFAGAEVLDPDGNPEWVETRSLPGSAAVVERLIVFRAVASDRTSSSPAVPTKKRTESDR